MVTLTRDDMIDGLREVVARLHERGSTASIRILGGAAMLLRYDTDRRVTPDIDASIQSNDDVDAIVREITDERGWPVDWLNSKAATFALRARLGTPTTSRHCSPSCRSARQRRPSGSSSTTSLANCRPTARTDCWRRSSPQGCPLCHVAL